MFTQITTHKERFLNFILLNFVGLGYMLTNYLVSITAPYPSVNMAWESSIPFISWIIFPYLSYFIIAPLIFFLPYKREKLAIYMFRFMFVAMITFLIFVLFPYENAFTRPTQEYFGLEWFLFELLKTDMPYNQMPSFHISLSLLYTIIIIDFFENKWIKMAIISWFLIICCSVLLLFQHHFADIISAVILVMITVKLSNIKALRVVIFKYYLVFYKLIH